MPIIQSEKARGRAIPAGLLLGETTVMRPVTPGDLPLLQAWDEDPVVTELMGRKYGETNSADWFRSLQTERTCRAWMIENKDGRVVGELELAHLNWRNGSTEMRICIGEKDCWNQGYGTDAVRTAMRLAFVGYELQEVYLRVFATNTRAIKVYERVGFRKTAVLPASERREDPSPVVLMSLTRQRWGARAVC
ncbi:MAG TPA: GNAT family protein [Symbiobacteriaceae bacterium]|jgi:RimJ/RimL family protein N-acetyltransferase